MNTVTVRILVFFLSLFIMITVFSQIGMQFGDDYVTETAVIYSSAEKVAFQGVYIRNETVITARANGVLSYTCPDGSKVANGSVVAYTYGSENDILVNRRIEKLREETELLESAQNPGTTDVAQAENIASLIDEQYQTIAFLIAENDLDSLAKERSKLQELMDIYQIVVNEAEDYNSTIDSINARIDDLSKSQKQPTGTVVTDKSGYFISSTDGFENKLSPDTADTLTAEDIRSIIDESRKSAGGNSGKAVGKIVNGYEWKMAGIVDPRVTDFRVGSEVTVKFASTPDTVTAVIDGITETDRPNESILILSCDELTFNLVQRRSERVEIILNDHEGIRIPRDAIRFDKNNEKGVYILLGQKISFKKIDPIYECDEYILSRITSDTSYISVYDDIITEGEISDDLYVPETDNTNEEEENAVPESTADDSTENTSDKKDSANDTEDNDGSKEETASDKENNNDNDDLWEDE